MNKIQYINLLNLRGVKELNNETIAEAVRRTGGQPTDSEMAEVNKKAMEHYIELYLYQKELVAKKDKEIQKLNQRNSILNALESAGVDNWEGYEIALENI